jgi:hypothetical protein
MDVITEGAQLQRPTPSSVLSLPNPHVVIIDAFESDESIPRAGNDCCPGATTLGCVVRGTLHELLTHDYTY